MRSSRAKKPPVLVIETSPTSRVTNASTHSIITHFRCFEYVPFSSRCSRRYVMTRNVYS